MWVFIALTAGSMQSFRNTIAFSVSRNLSSQVNTWSRFAFNLPWALVAVALLSFGYGIPSFNSTYFFYCVLGGITQLVANLLLVKAFSTGKLAHTIIFNRTEVVFGALFGVLLFAEPISLLGWCSIILVTVGVLGVGKKGRGWKEVLIIDKGSALSLCSGLILGLTPFFIKTATVGLVQMPGNESLNHFQSALWTVFHITWIEVVILTVSIVITDVKQFTKVPSYLPKLSAMGAFSFLGSLCWFWGNSIGSVAYVRAVGMVEVLITAAFSILRYKDFSVLKFWPWYTMIMVGIITLVLQGN